MAHYHHGNLRESLIQAGDDELRIVSPDGFSLRAISRKLKVSHNAPYRHFEDKKALLNEILLRALQELTERLQEAELIYPYSPLHQVQYFGRAWALMSLRHPRKVELLFGSLRQALEFEPLELQFKHMVSVLTGRLQSHIDQGQIAKTDVTLTAHSLISAFLGCALTVSSRSLPFGRDENTTDEEAFLLFDHTAENLLKMDAL